VKTIEEKILQAFPEEPLMLEIAYCESGIQTPHDCYGPINPAAKNKYSTATGVFQILIGTWHNYKCTGDRTNADDNIACARKIYDARGTRDWNASRHAWSNQSP
jgi:hypothetical protein